MKKESVVVDFPVSDSEVAIVGTNDKGVVEYIQVNDKIQRLDCFDHLSDL